MWTKCLCKKADIHLKKIKINKALCFNRRRLSSGDRNLTLDSNFNVNSYWHFGVWKKKKRTRKKKRKMGGQIDHTIKKSHRDLPRRPVNAAGLERIVPIADRSALAPWC